MTFYITFDRFKIPYILNVIYSLSLFGILLFPYDVVCTMLQGPLGWQSLSGFHTGEPLLDRDIDFYINADEQNEFNAISWEATIQKHVEEELYHSSLEVYPYSPNIIS